MEHQPFETWITDDAERTAEQMRALQAHLQECAQCRQLLHGWQAARESIRQMPQASPAPGFSRRFQASLAERRAYQQRLQTRRTFLGLSAVAVIAFLVLIGKLLLTSSPVNLLVKIIESVLGTLTGLRTLQQLVFSWLQVVPFTIPLVLWILFSIGFVILVAGWLFTLWRVTTQGVTNA